MVTRAFFLSCLAHFLPFAIQAAEHAHGIQAGVRSLDVFADSNRVHLLTGELRPGNEKAVLLHRSSLDGGATWTEPVRVDENLPAAHSLHRGMDAQIAATGDHVIAAWTTAGTDQWGSGPIATALSADGGKTWSAGPNPADDGSTTGHGFIDVAADAAGAFHLTWLDSRDGKQGLRYSRSIDHGKTWFANATVKPATCECCPNNLATDANGNVAILFRDGNPRDMTVSLSQDGGLKWSAPSPAGKFAWQFTGCPHVGGGLAITQGHSPAIHALVWTGLAENVGVYHVTSGDLGAHWSKPRRVGAATASHPDLAAASDGRLAAVWDDHENEQSCILAAVLRENGTSWSEPIKLSDSSGNASQPRVVATGKGFRVFWTQTPSNGPTVLRSAVIP